MYSFLHKKVSKYSVAKSHLRSYKKYLFGFRTLKEKYSSRATILKLKSIVNIVEDKVHFLFFLFWLKENILYFR